MAKLYAELTSDKGGRVANKGGEEVITIKLTEKNQQLFEITFKTTDFNAYIDILQYSNGAKKRVYYHDPDVPF